MRVLRFIVGVALLVVLFRTFVVIGVVEPVIVAGKSMAPALPEGKRVLIDRASTAWQPLRRWEPVVTLLPDDATQLGVKRVLGLPGERVEFRGGDLWIDGKLVRKTLAEQLALRQLVHRESESDRRWETPFGWIQRQKERLSIHPIEGMLGPTTLAFTQGILYDDSAINPNITRPLNPVADLMLCGTVQLAGDAKCEMIIARGGQTVRLNLTPRNWRLTIDATNPPAEHSGPLPPALYPIGRRVVFSLFDQQATVAIDEQPLASHPLPPMPRRITTPQELLLRSSGTVTVSELAVYRDVHYERRPTDLAPTDATGAWQLGADRWFLVGDNQAVSLDSRSWRTRAAGVPARLLVGRLLTHKEKPK